MNKERELLREIYADLEYDSKLPLWLRDKVRDCLATPSDDVEEPAAKPVLYIKDQELLYIQVLKQEGLAQEWRSNLGFVKEDGDVGLYTHPPKTADIVGEMRETIKMLLNDVISCECDPDDPWCPINNARATLKRLDEL